MQSEPRAIAQPISANGWDRAPSSVALAELELPFCARRATPRTIAKSPSS